VLAAESAGLGARPDPSYAWSSERRVPHRISLDRVALALVPGARRGEVADVLASRGRNPIELLPLEDFEVLRVVAETPTS
jgi:hypothetical protein